MSTTSDPMIYDVMRETSNKLVGTYLYRLNHTSDLQQQDSLKSRISAVYSLVKNINPNDQQTILTATSQFASLAKEQSTLIQVQKDHSIHPLTTTRHTDSRVVASTR
ncbi:hypothetical protein [Bifidobacterium sp. ESL0800]|uniref:hypothetical protein n=1 Tax=Bifidobacterium sp. ESL0800 TaxID=2983236 RepID=UPI0023F7ADAB|nr:hypothetical protein [Bifidobacterium sp. ESL0800]WEV75296.1 hypothetical protein OZX75_06585 [Bifidobacterium sp. ESL0800]